MAREFFVTPRVGSGTPADPHRPKVGSGLAGWVAACNATHCLVLAAGDTAATAGDGGTLAVAAGALDRPLAAVPAALRARVQAGLAARGIPVTVADHATVRDAVNAVGRWFAPGFDADRFFAAGD